MDFSFNTIDFNSILEDSNKKSNLHEDNNNSLNFDKTTTETYRIKRIFKIDPLTDLEVSEKLAFKFMHEWDPYTGIRGSNDIIGPLYFNAINLYDYFFSNRYKGLWNPPVDEYQGYYGDLLGTGKNIEIKSRGSNPEKYLYRIPIIDCYLPQTHNYSHITMGPELTDKEISEIDKIICKYHTKKLNINFVSLKFLKYCYDMALETSPNHDSAEIIVLKIKYPNLNDKEINEKFNRYWVDKLVNY